MKLLKKYIFKTYSQTFFPIFLTLFTVTSIIFLVKIASLTSVIQINFFELILLYSFSIPTILFYTLPVSVFVSLALSLSKLSTEYELIVITSFALNPLKIIKIILPSLLSITLLLLIISLALIPKTDQLKESFLKDKKNEAQFNIKSSEYGQEFGEWLIYVNDEKDGLYKDIVLFKQSVNFDTYIVAQYATLTNKNLSLSLNLKNGKAIKINDALSQVDFETMIINNEIKASSNINTINDLILFWNDIKTNNAKEAKFSFYILGSLFPLFSIILIIYIGYFNPRYQKNHSAALSLIFTVFYIVLIQKLSKEFGAVSILAIPMIWYILSYIVYRKKIVPYY